MTHARYGQMRIGRCVTADLGYIGCGADVMYLFDTKCSGKQSCSVRVGDENMGERSSCLSGLEQYLEADYVCKKALNLNQDTCQEETNTMLITSSALITSDSLHKLNCMRLNHAWSLSTTEGQHLNISLIDFAADDSVHDDVIGELRDASSDAEVPIQARSRHQHLMTSVGEAVEFQLKNDRRFAFDIKGMDRMTVLCFHDVIARIRLRDGKCALKRYSSLVCEAG